MSAVSDECDSRICTPLPPSRIYPVGERRREVTRRDDNVTKVHAFPLEMGVRMLVVGIQ